MEINNMNKKESPITFKVGTAFILNLMTNFDENETEIAEVKAIISV